jgi:hypothetical protein
MCQGQGFKWQGFKMACMLRFISSLTHPNNIPKNKNPNPHPQETSSKFCHNPRLGFVFGKEWGWFEKGVDEMLMFGFMVKFFGEVLFWIVLLCVKI